MNDVQRAIQAQLDEDVAEFISSLDQDVRSGVPPPPKIEITEVTSEAAELEFVPFGAQGAETTPSSVGIIPPPSEANWACCLPDGTCTDTTEPDCISLGGVWHEGQLCDDEENPCPLGDCCIDGDCFTETEVQCEADGGTWGSDTGCDPNPCCPHYKVEVTATATYSRDFDCLDGQTMSGSTTKTYTWEDVEVCAGNDINLSMSWDILENITCSTGTPTEGLLEVTLANGLTTPSVTIGAGMVCNDVCGFTTTQGGDGLSYSNTFNCDFSGTPDCFLSVEFVITPL